MGKKKQSKGEDPRDGRVKPGKDGEPAQHVPGGDARPPANFDEEEVAEEMGLHWVDGDGTSWILRGDDGTWSCWPETKVLKAMRMLPSRLISLAVREGERASEADRVLIHTMKNRKLDFQTQAIAGYPSGIIELQGLRVLVRTSPRLLKAAAGEWPTIRKLTENILKLDDGIDQTHHWYSWLKVACESLYMGGPGNFRPGQAVILAGRRNCGKSRLQHQIVTALLGGRSANPGPYMFARTDFNGELFAAEHLLIEEIPTTSFQTKDRTFFGEKIKEAINDTQRMHRKREDAVTCSPYWRLTITVNDDPDKMRVLPPLTPDITDKLMLFHCQSRPMPMPTATLDERAAFRAQLAREMPAFLHWLLYEYEIPAPLKDDRFGVRAFLHPGLAADLMDDSPAAELLMLLNQAEWTHKLYSARKLWELPESMNEVVRQKVVLKGMKEPLQNTWGGSAVDLEQMLTLHPAERDGGWTCTVWKQAEGMLKHNKFDRLLGRLKEDCPDQVRQWRKNTWRGWMIGPPLTGT